MLAGNGRLLERQRSDKLSPLNSRMRVRLALDRATPDELAELLVHALQKAGAPKLMTRELIVTLADHAQDNPRAAPSPKPLTIELAQRGLALPLEVTGRREPVTPAPSSLDDRIVAALADSDPLLPFAELRAHCRVRAATLHERIGVLTTDGRVAKSNGGYRLVDY